MGTARATGLDDVFVADTALSDVDGERGRLVIAGSEVEQLAATCDYEAAAARVLAAGGLVISEAELRAALGRERERAWHSIARLGDALALADGMDALRAALGQLASTGDDRADALAAIA